MKKTAALLLSLILLCTAAFALAEDDLLAQIQSLGKLTIATEGTWAPWTYHGDDGVLTGFDIEVGTLIAHGLGVEPEFLETDWDAILAGVDAGRFNMACNGVGYTEERAKKYSFSDPYIYSEAVLVVRSDNEDIHTLADLAGSTTANSPSSTYAEQAERAGATVTYVNTLAETIVLLRQGRVDATLNAKGSIDEYMAQFPDADIKVVQVLAGDPVCIPIRQGDDTQTLVARVNEILDVARADGTLGALSVKYFGVDLTKPQ